MSELNNFERDYLRSRAKEIRTIARITDGPAMRNTLLEIAGEIETFVEKRDPGRVGGISGGGIGEGDEPIVETSFTVSSDEIKAAYASNGALTTGADGQTE